MKVERTSHHTFKWTLPNGCDLSISGNEESGLLVDALFKDAERYRWLRAQNWFDNTICAVRRPKDAMKLGHDAPNGARLDAAIDEAMPEWDYRSPI